MFGELKAWRSAAARAADVPAFVIFHDSTLAELARARPASRQALLAVDGIGPVKAGRFGDDVLAVMARHRAANRVPCRQPLLLREQEAQGPADREQRPEDWARLVARSRASFDPDFSATVRG